MNKFRLRQYVKIFMQHLVFPFFYRIGKLRKVNPRLVIFADSHHNEVPYSMEDLYRWFQETDYQVIAMTKDCDKAGWIQGFRYMVSFMLVYARAGYVFICDNFLPAASCKKRKETKVIQMWHAGGMLKKYAYDTTRDIPDYYKGNVFENYSLIITSDSNCIPAYVSGMRANPEIVKPLGLSRTDRFYDESYLNRCKKEFYSRYPEYEGKKIVLWAPTFRGNAAMPDIIDMTFIEELQTELGEEWQVVVKLHPQMEKGMGVRSCDLPTERVFPVVDLMISDYSSVIYDFLLLERPFVFFVPDLPYYIENDELYIDYYEMPGKIVTDKKELSKAVLEEYQNYSIEKIRNFKKKYMSKCDGHAMERLITYLQL